MDDNEHLMSRIGHYLMSPEEGANRLTVTWHYHQLTMNDKLELCILFNENGIRTHFKGMYLWDCQFELRRRKEMKEKYGVYPEEMK